MVARLSQDVAAISHHLAWVSACLTELDRSLAPPRPAPQAATSVAPQQYWQQPQPAPTAAPQAPPTAAPYPQPQQAPQPQPERSDGWIGKALAAARTLIEEKLG